jgi:hypothetical protein
MSSPPSREPYGLKAESGTPATLTEIPYTDEGIQTALLAIKAHLDAMASD